MSDRPRVPRVPVRRPKNAPAAPTVEAAPAEPEPVVVSKPEPEPVGPPTPKLETDDLLALADMDPSELAALMDGAVERGIVEVGDKVDAIVSRVGHDTVFVDLGGKSEGQLERGEFPDVAMGDTITAYIVAKGEWGVHLSRQLQGDAAGEIVDEAHASGMPLEGKVTSRNKGGYEVRIGPVRAFCPMSLMSRLPEMDPDALVGQTLTFKVIETGDKIVLSRRALQEEEVADQAKKIWLEIEPGMEYRGVVRNTAAFGFFVDIGGVDGLVPRREIAWGSVEDPRTAVRVGQSVDVRVLDVDREARKLTFSCRNLDDDPWQKIGTEFMEGEVYSGIVVRLETFGAFVELDAGLSGLLHVSKLGGDTPQPGDQLSVRILGVDTERRRLDLGLSTSEYTGSATAEAVSEAVVGVVTDVLHNGVVVKLDDGRVGWLDARDAVLEPGTVLAQRYRRGKRIEARSTGERGGRVSLSTKADDASEDRSWRQAARKQKKSDKGFGTMGDLLKGLKL